MSYVNQMHVDSFKDHILVPHVDTPELKSFYLKRPKGGRAMSCLIVFTPEGIVILGDITPCQNGVISCLGYGLHWFTGDLSEDYLCEKFLTKVFRADKAVRDFKEMLIYKRRCDRNKPPLNGIRHPGARTDYLSRQAAREAWKWIEIWERDRQDPFAFYDEYSDIFNDSPEGCYGYDLGDAGWLCVIQQTFQRLYAAAQSEKESSVLTSS